MSIKLTIFRSIFDNKTHRSMSIGSWSKFVSLLRDLSHKPGYKPKKGERVDGSPLITPAIFRAGTTRANANVIEWGGWAALDVDDWTPEGMERLNEKLIGYTYVKYSTSSSSIEKPKFRLVFPLNRSVPAEKIRHLWYALNKEFAELGDPQTKDLARMFYIPAQYPGAYNFFEEQHLGEKGYLKVDELLARHPFAEKKPTGIIHSLPPELQQKVLEHRKNALKTNYMWKSYHDCPFVNQDLVKEYTFSSGNWYRNMYRIMTSMASKAIKRGYPITAREIADACREIDSATGNWYKNRNFELEAGRAIEFALKS
jgi:hypothetical protein